MSSAKSQSLWFLWHDIFCLIIKKALGVLVLFLYKEKTSYVVKVTLLRQIGFSSLRDFVYAWQLYRYKQKVLGFKVQDTSVDCLV